MKNLLDNWLPARLRKRLKEARASLQDLEKRVGAVSGFSVEIYWHWGGEPFLNEITRRTMDRFSVTELAKLVRSEASRIASRYCYDCGNKGRPLYPAITGVKVTPMCPSDWFSSPEILCNDVFDAYYAAAEVEP